MLFVAVSATYVRTLYRSQPWCNSYVEGMGAILSYVGSPVHVHIYLVVRAPASIGMEDVIRSNPFGKYI